MPIFKTLLMIAFGVVSVSLVVLILMQCGRGAGIGAAFGSGSSSTIFGSAGSGNFLTRITGILGGLFCVICLLLVYLTGLELRGGSVLLEGNGVQTDLVAPVIPEGTTGSVPGQEQAGLDGSGAAPGASEEGASEAAAPRGGSASEYEDVPALPVTN